MLYTHDDRTVLKKQKVHLQRSKYIIIGVLCGENKKYTGVIRSLNDHFDNRRAYYYYSRNDKINGFFFFCFFNAHTHVRKCT